MIYLILGFLCILASLFVIMGVSNDDFDDRKSRVIFGVLSGMATVWFLFLSVLMYQPPHKKETTEIVIESVESVRGGVQSMYYITCASGKKFQISYDAFQVIAPNQQYVIEYLNWDDDGRIPLVTTFIIKRQ